MVFARRAATPRTFFNPFHLAEGRNTHAIVIIHNTITCRTLIGGSRCDDSVDAIAVVDEWVEVKVMEAMDDVLVLLLVVVAMVPAEVVVASVETVTVANCCGDELTCTGSTRVDVCVHV